jgi:hypothetical protein
VDSFPDFENFTYKVAVVPPLTKITAWGKLQECERRLAMYQWAEALNDPRDPKYRVLLDDSVSAFLMTFEATLQFLKNQFASAGKKQQFEPWLKSQSANSLAVRGLRSLRHLEAHVEARSLLGQINVAISESLQGEAPAGATWYAWRLPALHPIDLKKLDSPKLQQADLTEWNGKSAVTGVPEVFEQGLTDLSNILNAAESLF